MAETLYVDRRALRQPVRRSRRSSTLAAQRAGPRRRSSSTATSTGSTSIRRDFAARRRARCSSMQRCAATSRPSSRSEDGERRLRLRLSRRTSSDAEVARSNEILARLRATAQRAFPGCASASAALPMHARGGAWAARGSASCTATPPRSPAGASRRSGSTRPAHRRWVESMFADASVDRLREHAHVPAGDCRRFDRAAWSPTTARPGCPISAARGSGCVTRIAHAPARRRARSTASGSARASSRRRDRLRPRALARASSPWPRARRAASYPSDRRGPRYAAQASRAVAPSLRRFRRSSMSKGKLRPRRHRRAGRGVLRFDLKQSSASTTSRRSGGDRRYSRRTRCRPRRSTSRSTSR